MKHTTLLASTLFAALFAAGCSGAAPSDVSGGQATAQSSTASGSKAALYDGETVFRGLLLGTGPMASTVPELRDPQLAEEAQNLSKEQLATYLQGAATRMRAESLSPDAAQAYERAAADLRSGALTPQQMLEARATYASTSGDAIVARIHAADPTFFDRFGAEMTSGDHVRVQGAFEDASKRLLDAASVIGALPGHVTAENRCLLVLVAVLYISVYAKVYLWESPNSVASDLHRTQLVDLMATRLSAN